MQKYMYLSVIISNYMKGTIQIQKRFQLSIPEAIRKAFELKEGDFIEVDITPVKKDTGWRNNAAKD